MNIVLISPKLRMILTMLVSNIIVVRFKIGHIHNKDKDKHILLES